MPTRRSPGHAQLSRVLCYFHPLQCSHGTIMLFSNHGGGGLRPPPHHTRAHFLLLLLRHWLPRAKFCCFSAKSDRCDSRARHSDGTKRYKLASMKLNTFAETFFLRLPRSYRVAEKSDPIDGFSGPDLQKITKNRWFLSNFSTTRHDRAKRRKTHLVNVSKRRLPIF